jgi:hypothetical protein
MSVKISSLFRERSPPRELVSKRKKKERKKRDTDETDREVGLLCLRETINLPGLKWIQSNLDAIVKEERTKFSSYAKQMEKSGSRLVAYSPVSHGKGRVYADGAQSLQSFSKKIRETLARKRYYDIDMVNAHPNILKGICEKNGWKCPKLNHYINHREVVLAQIVAAFTCTRGDAKILMLSLMYGGGDSAWREKRSLDKSIPIPTFITEYTRELETVASNIFECAAYEDIPIVTTRRPKFSKMSLLIQDIENKILMEMSRFFKLNGYEPGVYMFDGLMVYRKEQGTTGPMNLSVLKSCQDHLRDVVGWSVSLEEKPIGEGFKI